MRSRRAIFGTRFVAVMLVVTLVMQLAACIYIAPREKRRDTNGTIETLPVDTAGPAIPQAWARPVGPTLEVTGMWRQQCEERRRQRVEVRRHRGASLEVWTPCTSVDGGCILFAVVGILYSPVTLLFSGIYTGIAVSGDDDIVETQTMEIEPRRYACDRKAPGLNVRVSVPGRGDAMYTLDGEGFLRIELGDPASAAGATVAVPQ